MDYANRLMARVGIEMKKGRERFWETNDYALRLSRRRGGADAALFFRTRGCKHDLAGGCTMCDYSAGPPTTADYMVDCVRRGLEELPDGIEHLLVSPSGSMLDEWEVPLAARDRILGLLAETPCLHLAFESRAETLGTEAVSACRRILGDRSLKVYVGLESADAWISKYCINKELSPESFVGGIRTLNEHGVKSAANVLVGALFLSPAEAVEDAVTTARWAFDVGVTECCVFPTHVKKWTQVQWFCERGLYASPSLWSYLEVLRRLGHEVCSSRIEVAWFTSYGAFNIIESPTTCERCRDEVVEKLDGFARTNDFDFIEAASRVECACKDRWRVSMEAPASRLERAAAGYERVARELLGDRWWERSGDRILKAMIEDAERSSTRSVRGASGPGDPVRLAVEAEGG